MKCIRLPVTSTKEITTSKNNRITIISHDDSPHRAKISIVNIKETLKMQNKEIMPNIQHKSQEIDNANVIYENNSSVKRRANALQPQPKKNSRYSFNLIIHRHGKRIEASSQDLTNRRKAYIVKPSVMYNNMTSENVKICMETFVI
jgi:hypothetical protein